MQTTQTLPQLALKGVDHTARPTWKLKETLEFYRDTLGLPLVHTISARGWGPSTHPDFLHFFFDSGKGSTIAFFYYLGTDQPEAMAGREFPKPWPEDHVTDATHTAWLVDSEEELLQWREFLLNKGVNVSVQTRHEVIESIYFRDPNGYFMEIAIKLRPLQARDIRDAALTLQAAVELEQERAGGIRDIHAIDEVWQRKAESMLGQGEAGSVRLLVLKVPEFEPLLTAARAQPECEVSEVDEAYWQVRARQPLEFSRKALGVKPAVWYGLFTGGVDGRITVFDRDTVRIEP
jgi:catechol 2,3-dioxygenase-like lactoylglutathione lyase family enzyme